MEYALSLPQFCVFFCSINTRIKRGAIFVLVVCAGSKKLEDMFHLNGNWSEVYIITARIKCSSFDLQLYPSENLNSDCFKGNARMYVAKCEKF